MRHGDQVKVKEQIIDTAGIGNGQLIQQGSKIEG